LFSEDFQESRSKLLLAVSFQNPLVIFQRNTSLNLSKRWRIWILSLFQFRFFHSIIPTFVLAPWIIAKNESSQRWWLSLCQVWYLFKSLDYHIWYSLIHLFILSNKLETYVRDVAIIIVKSTIFIIKLILSFLTL